MGSTFSADEICAIARNQSIILWAILAKLLSPVLLFRGIIPLPVVVIVDLAIAVCVAVFLVKLRNAMYKNIVLTIICVILMIVPALSLIVLLVNNQSATDILKNAGLKVGLMGVSDAELKRFMDASNTTERPKHRRANIASSSAKAAENMEGFDECRSAKRKR